MTYYSSDEVLIELDEAGWLAVKYACVSEMQAIRARLRDATGDYDFVPGSGGGYSRADELAVEAQKLAKEAGKAGRPIAAHVDHQYLDGILTDAYMDAEGDTEARLFAIRKAICEKAAALEITEAEFRGP